MNLHLRVILFSLLAIHPTSLPAEDEITLGRTAGGRLTVKLEFEQPIVLEPFIAPGIGGHASSEFGIHSALFDEPMNDIFQSHHASCVLREPALRSGHP